MAYVCEHGDVDLTIAPATRESSAGAKPSAFRVIGVARRVLAAVWAWGEPDADAAIVRALQRSGGRLTDSIEREAARLSRYGDWRASR